MNVTPAVAGFGLLARGAAVPLEGVRIEARLTGIAAEVTLTQRFRNTEAVDVEAVYVFPLEEGAAVSGFFARVGDRLLRGRVEERDEAFAAYDDAMAEGHGAFLLDQERPNVFTTSVGNLRPGQAVEIGVTTVSRLRFEGEALRFTVPTTVSPRYVPASGPEIGQPDGERVNPERWLQVPYGLSLTVSIEGGPVRSVASPSHPIQTELDPGRTVVTLSQEQVALDRDFVLLVTPTETRRPSAAVAAEEDGARVAMITFLPELSEQAAGPQEVRFLLDCSGSMGGSSMDQARRALALCLRALSEGDTFNIHRFGSRHDSLWPAPRPYDQGSLNEASAWLARVDADLGGTEILEPLKALLDAPVDPSRPRQVLLLTDGQVSNEAEIIALCERSAARARVFAFGIGAGASDHLVRGVARATRASAEMIAPGERMEPVVLRIFGRIRTPALSDVRVDWGDLSVEQAPRVCPPVFQGDALTVLGRIQAGAGATQHTVTLHAGDQRFPVALDLEHAERGGAIPVLWARERIRELERGDAPRPGSQQRRGADRTGEAIVALGKRYGLMSSRTSYVAVEERAEGERTEGAAELRRVPIALTHGWGGVHAASRGAGRAGAMPPMAAPQAAYPMPNVAFSMAAPAPPAATRKRSGRGVLSAIGRAFGLGADTSPPAGPSAGAPLMVQDSAVPYAAAPAAPGSSVQGDPLDLMYEVLMTQQADGRFPWSEALERWLGDVLDAARAVHAAHGDERAATALILALLRRTAAEREDEWTAAAAKARAWLERSGGPVDLSRVWTA